MGTPDKKEWFEGYQLASAMNFKFPQFKKLVLNTVVPNASRDGIHLMELLLSWNPIRRPSAQSALRQPYFQVGQQRLSQDIGEVSYTKVSQQKRQPVQLMKSQISLLQTNNNKQIKYEKQWEMNKPTGIKDKTWYGNDSDVIVLNKKKLSAKQHYLSVARYVTGKASNLQAAENENMLKNIKNEKCPSVSKVSYIQSDNNRNSKRQTGGKTDWASKYLQE